MPLMVPWDGLDRRVAGLSAGNVASRHTQPFAGAALMCVVAPFSVNLFFTPSRT